MDMGDFEDFLGKSGVVSEKQIPYFSMWVSKFFSAHSKKLTDPVDGRQVDTFANGPASRHEDRQVEQTQKTPRTGLSHLAQLGKW